MRRLQGCVRRRATVFVRARDACSFRTGRLEKEREVESRLQARLVRAQKAGSKRNYKDEDDQESKALFENHSTNARRALSRLQFANLLPGFLSLVGPTVRLVAMLHRGCDADVPENLVSH